MIKEAIIALLVVLSAQSQCNATTGNYISEFSLGQQDQLNDTTAIICPNIKIQEVVTPFDGGTLTLSNVSLTCIFADGKQIVTAGNETLTVSGGKIEFQAYFNFSASRLGQNQTGDGYASVFSDPINFTKDLAYGSGRHLNWFLDANKTQNLSLTQNFTVKRYHPSSISDAVLNAIKESLNVAKGSVQEQIVEQYNANFTQTLNKTLREENIFSEEFNYTFHHPVQGELNVTFTNNIFQFDLAPKTGLVLQFLTKIKDDNVTDDCTSEIPGKPEDYQYYGGIQSVHHIDLYRKVFNYNLRQKWLDTILDASWNTNSFQLYAGDLFDIIPKVATSIPARSRLAGTCNALNDSNTDFSRNGSQTFLAKVNYNCQIHSDSAVKLAQFSLITDFLLTIGLEYESMTLKISNASGIPTFKPVGQYLVTELELAKFKINEALKSTIGQRVFGDGFPTWPRDFPNVEVRKNYTFFYDSSQIPHQQRVNVE